MLAHAAVAILCTFAPGVAAAGGRQGRTLMQPGWSDGSDASGAYGSSAPMAASPAEAPGERLSGDDRDPSSLDGPAFPPFSGGPTKDPGQDLCERTGTRELDLCDTEHPDWLRYCFRYGDRLQCRSCGVESLDCCPAVVVEDGEVDDGCVDGLYCDEGTCYNVSPTFPPGFPDPGSRPRK